MKLTIDNSALAIIVGQAFLSVVFLYVSIENRFSDMEIRFGEVKTELTIIKTRLDRLEELHEKYTNTPP